MYVFTAQSCNDCIIHECMTDHHQHLTPCTARETARDLTKGWNWGLWGLAIPEASHEVDNDNEEGGDGAVDREV